MNRYKNHLIIAAVLSVLAVIGTIMNSRQASAQDGGPHVTIDSPIPLPVTGSVTSTVTGTVGLASGASVRVNNTVTDPVRVRNVNDAIQPFFATAVCNSFSTSCETNIFSVPAGKRAVIEYFSGGASVGTGRTATPELLIGAMTYFVPQTSPQADFLLATWGQQVRLYADSGPISCLGVGSGGAGAVAFTFSISGYLVDVPFTP
jgi:hypothetical protein